MNLQQMAMLPAVHGAAAFLAASLFVYRAAIVTGARSAAAAIAAKLPSWGRTNEIEGETSVVDTSRHDCLRELRHDVSELPPDQRTKGLDLLDQIDELVRNLERAPMVIKITGLSCCGLDDCFDPMASQLKPGPGDGPAPRGGGAT